MKKNAENNGLLFFLVLSMASCSSGIARATYTNPVGEIARIGDPYALKYGNMYYLYGTSPPRHGFKVWESGNLVDWTDKGLAFDARVDGNNWGINRFWAPEVTYYKDKFYMIYSAGDEDGVMKIAIAASKKPLGPFINVRAPLFDRGTSFIDGHIFLDDGTPYLFYVKDCSQNIINGRHISQIFVQEMSKDLLSLKGLPKLVVQPDQEWEGLLKEYQWNEGPFALRRNGIYYLMYSANFFASADYGVGYATASSPLGPWEKYEANPILRRDPSVGVSGPGHNSVTTSPDGSELFIVYHSHLDPENPRRGRTLNIDRLYFERSLLKVKGPTLTPQPMPSR